mmetsp:Transcript_46378/g.140475  ORF Transcript_46378/g.140475 Transcript_46378/m.140475 type:complete len:220 (-) Transcript_46378:206-865(-)
MASSHTSSPTPSGRAPSTIARRSGRSSSYPSTRKTSTSHPRRTIDSTLSFKTGITTSLSRSAPLVVPLVPFSYSDSVVTTNSARRGSSSSHPRALARVRPMGPGDANALSEDGSPFPSPASRRRRSSAASPRREGGDGGDRPSIARGLPLPGVCGDEITEMRANSIRGTANAAARPEVRRVDIGKIIGDVFPNIRTATPGFIWRRLRIATFFSTIGMEA